MVASSEQRSMPGLHLHRPHRCLTGKDGGNARFVQCGLNQGGSSEADTQESLWKTYRGRLRKLILANPPLLLLIIGCLPLFLVLVPTASSLNSYSAPTTPLDDAAEFEKPASSIAANAAAAANDQIDADVQNAPHLPERHHHTSRTPASRRGDVVSHRDKAFQTTRRPQRTTGRRSTTREEEKEEEIIRTTGSNLRRDSPSPPGKNLTELEHVPGKKLTSPWTRGPSQALTGPKGRRLVRRVVRKRRRTTPELASNTPTEAPVSHLGTTAVAAAGSLEDRKTDETQEPGKHLQGISFAKAPAPSGRIETSGTSATPSTSKGSSLSIAQASEALSGAKGQRQSDVSARSSEATVGVPTNETCDDSSRCRVPSYNEGFGSLNGMTREKPGAFQHSSELTGDVTSPSRTRESNDELTETAATYSIAPGLLDWLFDHGANNGLSEKETDAKKEGIFRYEIDHPANHQTNTSDNRSGQSSRVSAMGAGFSATAESHKVTPENSKNWSSEFPNHITGVDTATTSSSHQIATDSALRAETFRKVLNGGNVTSLITTSSPSKTPVEASSGRYRGLRTVKAVEDNVSLSHVRRNEHSVTASKDVHSKGNRFSGSVDDELFPSSREDDTEGGNARSGSEGHVVVDEGSSEEDYDDDYDDDYENEYDDEEDGDDEGFAGPTGKPGGQDALMRKGSFPTLGPRQGLVSEPEGRTHIDNKTRAPVVAVHKNLTFGSHTASVTGGENKTQRKVGGAATSHDVDFSTDDDSLRPVRGASGSRTSLRLDQSAAKGISARSTEFVQAMIETNLTGGTTPVAGGSSGIDKLQTTFAVERRAGSSTKQSRVGDAEVNASGSSVETATAEGHAPAKEHTQEPPHIIRNNTESHNLSEPTKVGSTAKASWNTISASASSDRGGDAISGLTSSIRTSSTMNLSSTTPLSHLGDIQNASVVSGVPKTELSITSTTKTSTRRRLRLETTLHNTVPVVLELTSPTGTVSSKAQGHTLPKKLNIMCSIGATYPGPYPVDLCDKILIKDAVAFDQVRIKFTVRSYDAFLALKAQQVQRGSFKIVGLMTWRNIEQFRLLNPSSDAFVEKVERLLLRINLDGLCMDLAGVTRGNIMAYRHILRDMRVRLMDTKFLCSLFDYNVLYKASFQDLLSLLRVFNTTVIHQSVQSISNMETSVPNALRHLTRRKYSLTAALELAMEIRGTSHHRGVCWTLTPWGMEYRLLLPTEATGVGVLARFVRSAVSGSDLCTTYRKLPRSFDNMTATWYFVNDTKWIAYDDRNSLEQKVISTQKGCVVSVRHVRHNCRRAVGRRAL
ncbi:uncharacterized protein LOC142803632 isoform X3 [Rhipicephalus microplus]|uniref:uncharacterized protein LOC142803632 isoform X3 n=1 Tax=Rhipicephalus microplus TaxID=6941 RepID=UPI003F6C8E3A